jgi:transcriptional regulator with XRE-family HTH domain
MHHIDNESQPSDKRIKSAVKMAVLIRALRNAFVMSQSYLAELSRTSRPTINRIETMDKRSARSETIDDVLQVFRDRGAEITVSDEEVTIRFTRTALLYAVKELEMSAVERDKHHAVTNNNSE